MTDMPFIKLWDKQKDYIYVRIFLCVTQGFRVYSSYRYTEAVSSILLLSDLYTGLRLQLVHPDCERNEAETLEQLNCASQSYMLYQLYFCSSMHL